MTIGIFVTITRPEQRGDNIKDALECYNELADVVTVVDGDKTWPHEFSWELIGEHFQRGYEQTDTDWVIHCDVDFLFHERDLGRIRQALKDYPKSPAVSFYKWQFVQPHKYNLKSRLILAVNKKAFGDRIKFNGDGDLCQPTLDGNDLNLSEMPQAGVPFYNYEHMLKTKEQITEDVDRMDRAYQRRFGKRLYSTETTSAFDGWWHMVVGRYNKPQRELSIDQHPKYIKETIMNLKPEQFGYNGFGKMKGGYHA